MITITNDEELEKYKNIETVKDDINYVFYEFVENGELADVKMDIEFSPSSDGIFQSLFNDFENSVADEEEPIDMNLYIVRCKNITFTKKCGFDVIEAENLYSSAYCFIEKIKVSGDIKAEKIESLAVECQNITANQLICDSISAQGNIFVNKLAIKEVYDFDNLKANELVINGCILYNVSANGNTEG